MAGDSSDIDAALLAKLGADATLLAICANGVKVDVGEADDTKFVIVSLVDEADAPMFGGRALEDTLYLVKAVMYFKAGVNMALPDIKGAAARIDALLENQPLTVAGYSYMTMRRESRVRFTEVDDEDTSIRWFHRGGNYRVVMST